MVRSHGKALVAWIPLSSCRGCGLRWCCTLSMPLYLPITERRANLEDLYEGHRKGHIRHIPKVQGTAGTQHNGQEAGCKEVHPRRWPKLHRSCLAVHPCCRSKTVSQAKVLLSSVMCYVSSEHCRSQPEPYQHLTKAGAVWDCTVNPCKVICSMRAGWGLSLARLDALLKSRGQWGTSWQQQGA